MSERPHRLLAFGIILSGTLACHVAHAQQAPPMPAPMPAPEREGAVGPRSEQPVMEAPATRAMQPAPRPVPEAGPSAELSLDQCRRLAGVFFDLSKELQMRHASDLRRCIDTVTDG